MQARVREQAPNRVCTAFGGHEFVIYEWRDVPSGFEGPARGHSYLEVDDIDPDVQPTEPEGEPVLAVDIEDLPFNDLRKMASAKGVAKRGMKKADLVSALRDD